MMRFSKVLVANRGEIAVRIIRGARKQGYQTIAVYSDADALALHVREADEAIRIGPAPANDSYLSMEAILAAAQRSGAQAIHPGYGFLSERAEFATAVQAAGLVFIGPDPDSIAAMGNKSASKRRMLEAGVPCVPGYQGQAQGDEALMAEAMLIGLPVMVKASAGGGGRGMRLVTEEAGLQEAIRSARSEAASAFGSGELLIEKAVLDGRHVEIQVFGDRHGNVVHFGERDCSVQRRNQKVVEEAPSPAVDDGLRRKMGEAAVAAARAVHYVGAGTVEFLLGAGRNFYFLEMNTRLQVEHPVTEMVYGVDLVAWQLSVAQGDLLPLTQAEILARRSGHAIEVRLCAEDPRQNYLPQTGRVVLWQPPEGDGIRVDSGLETGASISPYYDSMQAKIIAWGADRESARARLQQALRNTLLLGVSSNRDYLKDVLDHEAFSSGDFDTSFVGRFFPQARIAGEGPSSRHVALAAVALYLDDAWSLAAEHALSTAMLGWHSSHSAPVEIRLKWNGRAYRLALEVRTNGQFRIQLAGETLEIDIANATSAVTGEIRYLVAGVGLRSRYARSGDRIWLDAEGRIEAYVDETYLAAAEAASAASDGRVRAHSDGKIVAMLVRPGDLVQKGQTLAVLEAMKMEFQLAAPTSGTVESVAVLAGTQVKGRQLLLQITPAVAG